MKSPYTGKEMILKKESRTFTFRKKDFNIIYHFYFCEESKEQFVDTKLATLNQSQIHNQYRETVGIPFIDKIKSIRSKYQVSAKKLSEILGLGVNSYRLYENGEVPSVANGRLILSIDNPSVFIEQVTASAPLLSEKDVNKLITTAKALQEGNQHLLQDLFFHPYKPTILSGYKSLDLALVVELIAFFQEKTTLYKTKLNKLLFYADFSVFKETGYSLTGLQYRAITFGPVPKDYDLLYSFLANQDKITIEEVRFSNGSYGDEIKIKTPPAYSFDPQTTQILQNVRRQLKSLSAKEIVALSHQEKAWIEHEKKKSVIPYLDGFWVVGLK